MNLKNLSIFLPKDTNFYRSLLTQMISAFKECDIVVNGRCGLLGEELFMNWIKEHKPDAVLEMNRVASEAQWLPKSLKHISWIVDFGGRDQSQISGSDITYFFDPGWYINYDTGGYSDWLPPGACRKVYFPIALDTVSEFVFLGHIPAPWSQEELGEVLGYNDNTPYFFSDLLRDYIDASTKFFSNKTTHKDLKDLCFSLLFKNTGETMLSQKIQYDLLERTKRIDSRLALIGTALKYGAKDICIYGSETWKMWNQYKDYYIRFIANPEEIKRAYLSAKFCLHDGVGVHFRSMDCMASGGVIFYSNRKNYKISKNEHSYGLRNFFEPNVHYLEFDSDDEFREVYCKLSHDKKTLKNIRENASVAIMQSHTWKHRAEKIINDFSKQL